MKQFTIISLVCVLALLMIQACTDFDTPAQVEIGKGEEGSLLNIPRKVLWINIDGAVGNVVKQVMPDNIGKMIKHSKYNWNGLSEQRTLKNENGEDPVTWTTLLTGVYPRFHKVIDKSYTSSAEVDPSNPNEKTVYYPSIVDYIAKGDPSKQIMCITPWEELNKSLLSAANLVRQIDTDEEIKNTTIEALKNDDYSFTLVAFKGVLEAGKNGGFSTENSNYVNAIQTVDAYIGEILEAINSRESAYYEDWLIIVSSNHGGTPDGHYGGDSYEECNTFGLFYYTGYSEREMQGEVLHAAYFTGKMVAELIDTMDYYSWHRDKEFSVELLMRVDPQANGSYDQGAGWYKWVGKKGGVRFVQRDTIWNEEDPTKWDKIEVKEDKFEHSWSFFKQRNQRIILYNGLHSDGTANRDQRNIDNAFGDMNWHNTTITFKSITENGWQGLYYDANVYALDVPDPSTKPGFGGAPGRYPLYEKTDKLLYDPSNLIISAIGILNNFYISELRIWNKAVDISTALMTNSTLNIDEKLPIGSLTKENLVGYWKFEPDAIVNDTIIKNQIQGREGFVFYDTSVTPQKAIKPIIVGEGNTLRTKRESGDLVVENTLFLPQILYWFDIPQDVRVNGSKFLDLFAHEEEWRVSDE